MCVRFANLGLRGHGDGAPSIPSARANATCKIRLGTFVSRITIGHPLKRRPDPHAAYLMAGQTVSCASEIGTYVRFVGAYSAGANEHHKKART
jgi:hypothetical protein